MERKLDKQWKTVEQIALERRISVEEAHDLVWKENCPKVFHGTHTLYLI
ncbi:hypothetical protein [Methylobacterium nodulans]|uniref:Uncharacterized protein n=1 Tax=Methylobacterium nodulans (strain LMG 21967 / CNCM I-2342 / ORS 2060) TaxID=460265 RepID=B8IQG1_METNO|nr:hypothetical protein [Methylobacterium nodulans]ACL60473.1 hypothetical protein Mnod_5632 [Methylobacterium nodulans ORS 2060]